MVVAIGALSVSRPSSPQFLSSLFISNVREEVDSIWLRATVTLISSTFHVYILICLVQISQLIAGPIVLFMFTISDIAGGQPQSKMGSGSSRLQSNPNGGVRLYRELQLLTNEYNNMLALFHAILHGIALSTITLCFYIFVRTEGIMAAFAAYTGMWGLPAYCEMMNDFADILTGSRTFLESLKESGSVRSSGNWMRTGSAGASAAIIRRELRSLRELRIKGGSSFYFDKKLVLTLIGIILQQSVNLLILT